MGDSADSPQPEDQSTEPTAGPHEAPEPVGPVKITRSDATPAGPAPITDREVWASWNEDPWRGEILALAIEPEGDVIPGHDNLRAVLVLRDADDRIIGGTPALLVDNQPAPDDEPLQLFATVDAEELPDDLAAVDVHLQEGTL